MNKEDLSGEESFGRMCVYASVCVRASHGVIARAARARVCVYVCVFKIHSNWIGSYILNNILFNVCALVSKHGA